MEKINQEVLEFARQKCYEQILFEMITQNLRERVKVILKGLLWNYDINSIICDQTNNPCAVVDTGRIFVEIVENHPYVTDTKIIHKIIL
jgi:hypothetical protein